MDGYTKEKIDVIVEQHREDIINYIRDLQRHYAFRSEDETIIVLLNLRNSNISFYIEGHGMGLDAKGTRKGIKEGYTVEVFRFESGQFADMALEDVLYYGDNEASRLYKQHRDGEISGAEYDEKYHNVVAPLLAAYIEDCISTVPILSIDYLNTIKDNK
jgi:hypothetical protein